MGLRQAAISPSQTQAHTGFGVKTGPPRCCPWPSTHHPGRPWLANDLADWSHWIQLGLVDEVVVQIYRHNPERLAWELAQPTQTAELGKARRNCPNTIKPKLQLQYLGALKC